MNIPHPCYDDVAHFKVGRIHLPIAPLCNIKCNYCERKIKSKENRPGVSNEILNPQQALIRVKQALKNDQRIKVIAVAGPGDPLANQDTFKTFKLIKNEIPDMTFCLSTNGLELPGKLELLINIGIKFITVTLNTINPKIGAKIYAYVHWQNKVYMGEKAARILIKKQLEGIEKASKAGLRVKVNTVFIPGINSDYIHEVAKIAREKGAYIMNIMPLIPLGRFNHTKPPSLAEIERIRTRCETFIRQWRLCKQCRADAIGVPGEERRPAPLLDTQYYIMPNHPGAKKTDCMACIH